MTHDEAVATLKDGGPLPRLAKAIGTLGSDPSSTPDEIMLGLSYSGFVQEQAALALHRRIGIPIPTDRNEIITDRRKWASLTRGSNRRTDGAGLVAQSSESPAFATGAGLDLVSSNDALKEFLIRGLERRERLLVVLYYYEEMSLREIAEVMDLGERAVHDMHRKILKGFREHLASDAEPLSRLLKDVAAEIAA